MNIEYVKKHTIFETVVGSQAYGINTPDSDFDKAGVMIPDKFYFFGFKKFEQFQDFDEDKTIYDVRKAISLITDNNPNMMDLLWMPERCIIKVTPYWQKIIDNRELFVSKKCRYTYLGYAVAQLRRIKSHRKFLLDPPKCMPKRSDFGLSKDTIFPTIQLKAIMSTVINFIASEERSNFVNELDKIYSDYIVPLISSYLQADQRIVAMEWLQLGTKSQAKTFLAAGPKYIKEEYIDQAEKEVRFYNALKEYKQYNEWSKRRNKKRAKLELKFGYDTKHGAHLVRLCRMGKEILKTGKVNIDRTSIDAEELKEIRRGLWPYEQIEEYAKMIDKEMDNLYKSTSLQRSADRNKIQELCVNVCDEYLTKEK